MANIVMLFLCLAIGMALRAFKRVPDNAHVGINAFIIHVSLPALIFDRIHRITFDRDLLFAALMPWILFVLATVIFVLIGRSRKLEPATTGALILTAGLGNTSFVGLPMIETFYGTSGLPIGILIDQLGTYLVLSTLGITVACLYSGKSASGREIAYRIATFPPLIALVLAVALSSLHYPDWLSTVLHRLSDTLAPLALVSVGLQLRLDQLSGNKLSLGQGLAFKLLVGPALIAILYVVLLRQNDDATRVTLFEAGMGPQIGGAIVAVQYGLNPTLVTLMVGIGITLSFATLPLWWMILRAI